MNESNEFDLTSGEGSILIEIVADALPITPEVLRRPRVRPGRTTEPESTEPPSDQGPNDSGPGE